MVYVNGKKAEKDSTLLSVVTEILGQHNNSHKRRLGVGEGRRNISSLEVLLLDQIQNIKVMSGLACSLDISGSIGGVSDLNQNHLPNPIVYIT